MALEETDDLSGSVFRAFRMAFLLHKQLLEKALAEKGSHLGEAMVLRVLSLQDGMSQRDLADTMHLSRPRITGILQGMEKAGALVRRPDEEDQRLTRAYLTAEGHRMDKALRSTMSSCISHTMGAMSVEDRQELARLLGLLAQHTSEALRNEGSGTTR